MELSGAAGRRPEEYHRFDRWYWTRRQRRQSSPAPRLRTMRSSVTNPLVFSLTQSMAPFYRLFQCAIPAQPAGCGVVGLARGKHCRPFSRRQQEEVQDAILRRHNPQELTAWTTTTTAAVLRCTHAQTGCCVCWCGGQQNSEQQRDGEHFLYSRYLLQFSVHKRSLRGDVHALPVAWS